MTRARPIRGAVPNSERMTIREVLNAIPGGLIVATIVAIAAWVNVFAGVAK